LIPSSHKTVERKSKKTKKGKKKKGDPSETSVLEACGGRETGRSKRGAIVYIA